MQCFYFVNNLVGNVPKQMSQARNQCHSFGNAECMEVTCSWDIFNAWNMFS
uniref:Uncharacterized protein n=1 Tax=Arundo donax TaxID=35708 RepID=A0A0A9DDT5_ARUDO